MSKEQYFGETESIHMFKCSKPEATKVIKSARAEEEPQKHTDYSMAHMPSGEKMRCKILDAEAAVDKEWDSLKKNYQAEASRESNPSQK